MYIKKILLAIVLLGMIAMGIFAYYVYNTVIAPNTAFNNDVANVYIPTNATPNQVLQELEPLLRNVDNFKTVAEKKGYLENIKAGHFIIKKGMNNNEIINTIRSKNIPIMVKFNNMERLEDLAGNIANQIEADSLSLLTAMKDSDYLKKVDLNADNGLAMYIPNTYEFYWNSRAETFRDRMKTEYDRFWNPARRQKAKDLDLTPEQVTTLAAIVQKETAKVDERPRVAGVYLNRLKVGMLLQADPTVIFAKKKTDNDFNQIIKRVLYVDLEIDSPYNTYKYAGVPPGPITMPDISSIEAVLNAEDNEYYYFVADVTNFGYHKFAKNLSQHNANKQAYVNWINANGVNR